MFKHNILFIGTRQFGLQKNFYQFIRYYNRKYNITYISYYEGIEKSNVKNIKLIYIFNKNIIIRKILFFFKIFNEINKKKYSLIILSYFTGSSLIGLYARFKQIKILLDIRSGGISKLWRVKNFFILIESKIFCNVTIISSSLAKYLKLKNYFEFTIGVDSFFFNNILNLKNNLNLIYIGILNKRNIEDTILGVKIFKENFPDIKINYKIIGFGKKKEEKKIVNLINKLNLQSVINFIGYVPHNKLLKHVKEANIGIVYIPILKYYQFQPPLKLIEYFAAGLPVIATNTLENRKFVREENGVIINDTPFDFYIGLKEIFFKLEEYIPDKIRKTALNYEWKKVVEKFDKFILRILNE